MGYDTVLKDMKRRNMKARVAAREKQDNDAGTLQNEIFRALPTHEADAISVRSLKKLFPNEPMMRVTTNVFSLFNYGRCRRIKRHDHPRYASVVHYYYWKKSEDDKEVKETPVATAVAEFSVKSPKGASPKNPVFGLTTRRGIGKGETLREKVLKELSAFGEYAINVQTIYKRMDGAHTKSSIGGTLAFLHINNYVEREKRGKYFYYWRKMEEKKEEGKEQVPKKKKNMTSLQEGVYSELPEDEKIAITSKGLSKRMGHLTYNTGIGATLTFLYFDGRIERKKRGLLFYFWKNTFSEKDVMEKRRKRGGETKKRQKKRSFLIEALPIDREEGLSCRDLYIRSGGEIPYNSISHELFSLFRERQIDREWSVREFRYWRIGSNIKEAVKGDGSLAVIHSESQDILLEQYKEDNKKLDERIVNIQKQIVDLRQKQELQAEIQKREENEKRLAELEEQLHKIAIADTSVKRGILY